MPRPANPVSGKGRDPQGRAAPAVVLGTEDRSGGIGFGGRGFGVVSLTEDRRVVGLVVL